MWHHHSLSDRSLYGLSPWVIIELKAHFTLKKCLVLVLKSSFILTPRLLSLLRSITWHRNGDGKGLGSTCCNIPCFWKIRLIDKPKRYSSCLWSPNQLQSVLNTPIKGTLRCLKFLLVRDICLYRKQTAPGITWVSI